jgi:hypothetical protein
VAEAEKQRMEKDAERSFFFCYDKTAQNQTL